MQEGISVTEACASNRIGTKEDFERSCNPDGTVKEHKETTTFSLKNSDNSITTNNTSLQVGLVVAVVMIVVLTVLIIRQLKRKTK